MTKDEFSAIQPGDIVIYNPVPGSSSIPQNTVLQCVEIRDASNLLGRMWSSVHGHVETTTGRFIGTDENFFLNEYAAAKMTLQNKYPKLIKSRFNYIVI